MNTQTFYTLVTENSFDRTYSHNEAFRFFCDCVGRQVPVRIYKTELDVETGAFESAREVSGDFADALQGVAA